MPKEAKKHYTIIRGFHVADDGYTATVEITAHIQSAREPNHLIAVGHFLQRGGLPCPDCTTGTLEWAEAGYVPGHRICGTCGSHWKQSWQERENMVVYTIRRSRFYLPE